MNKSVLFLFLILIFACKEPEPRRPVQHKSGSFYTESIERSRQILTKEESQIEALIKKDTANSYFQNPNGFWYFYEQKRDSIGQLPLPDDEVILAYNIMNFENDTLYTFDDIGVQQIMVDKTKLFPGLRNAVKVLKEGERATFLFLSSQAYGYTGDNKKIGANVPIKSSLELIKINNPVDSLNTNTQIE